MHEAIPAFLMPSPYVVSNAALPAASKLKDQTVGPMKF